MAEVGTQVNITELRDILPVGTVVEDTHGDKYTRVSREVFGWQNEDGGDGYRPMLPLVIVSRPN